MRHEFALDHMPTYAVESADPERRVGNPAWKAKQKELKGLEADLAGAQKALGQAVSDGKDDGTVQALRKRISQLEARLATVKDERADLPKEVPLRTLLDEEEIIQLERERKRITDVIKMAAYRAETELAALVGPSLGFHHQDEARSFLREVFNLPADLVPDEKRGTLKVRLYGMANPRSTRALAELCRTLNDQPGYDTCFPGTRLRLRLEPPALQD